MKGIKEITISKKLNLIEKKKKLFHVFIKDTNPPSKSKTFFCSTSLAAVEFARGTIESN